MSFAVRGREEPGTVMPSIRISKSSSSSPGSRLRCPAYVIWESSDDHEPSESSALVECWTNFFDSTLTIRSPFTEYRTRVRSWDRLGSNAEPAFELVSLVDMADPSAGRT